MLKGDSAHVIVVAVGVWGLESGLGSGHRRHVWVVRSCFMVDHLVQLLLDILDARFDIVEVSMDIIVAVADGLLRQHISPSLINRWCLHILLVCLLPE